MGFAEQLQTMGRKLDQKEYEEARLRLITEMSEERLRTAIEEEYQLFREECLKAAQRGEWRCTMQIERDRYRGPKRVGEILVDKSFSEEGKWSCANLTSAMSNCFTETEAETVKSELESRLREDGFSGAMVTVMDASDRDCEAYRFRVDVSAAWWNIVK